VAGGEDQSFANVHPISVRAREDRKLVASPFYDCGKRRARRAVAAGVSGSMSFPPNTVAPILSGNPSAGDDRSNVVQIQNAFVDLAEVDGVCYNGWRYSVSH
jgi:hypothetical protein